MKAIVPYKGEKTPVLKWESVQNVICGPDQVIMDVRATAVNRADLLQGRGKYPPPPGVTEIMGLEAAGLIEALGKNVTGRRVGERVCALLPGGGYAEKAVADHRMLMRMPDEWSFAQGAAVPEVWLTAFSNLFMEGLLKPGERVLIHAGASGVGTAAIQLARAVGAEVFTTAGSDEKIARCLDLGAAAGINYKTEDFAEVIKEKTGGTGVDLILDTVGGAYLERNIRILASYGRLVTIGLLGGVKGELDLGRVLGKSLTVKGTRLRARPLAEKIEITRRFSDRFLPMMIDGKLKPVIDTVFPIVQAQEAHRRVAENKTSGKVILAVHE